MRERRGNGDVCKASLPYPDCLLHNVRHDINISEIQMNIMRIAANVYSVCELRSGLLDRVPNGVKTAAADRHSHICYEEHREISILKSA